MRYKFLFIIFLLFAFSFTFYVANADETSDKIAELQAKIDELTKQAEQYRGSVLEKQKEANTLKQQIALLNAQISRLETEINITEKRITTAGIEIGDLQERIYDAQKDIEFKKATIGELMVNLNERDQASILMTLVKNPSLSDFANEAQQAETLNTQLNLLLDQIKEEKIRLEAEKVQVEKKKNDLLLLSQRQETQKISLSGTKSSKNKLLIDTKGQESKYQQLLSAVEKQKADFFAELQSMEQTAIANGTAIVKITATDVPKRGTKIFQMPYKDQYYQTQGYGMTTYARRGAYGGAGHNGIDVASGCSSPIYSIGTGMVVASGNNAGFGNFVAIKLDGGGGMVSIFGHMVRGTSLANGTRVTTDTVVGYEGTTGTSTGCHVHLSLYKNFFTYINPKNNQLYFNYMDGTVNPLDYIAK